MLLVNAHGVLTCPKPFGDPTNDPHNYSDNYGANKCGWEIGSLRREHQSIVRRGSVIGVNFGFSIPHNGYLHIHILDTNLNVLYEYEKQEFGSPWGPRSQMQEIVHGYSMDPGRFMARFEGNARSMALEAVNIQLPAELTSDFVIQAYWNGPTYDEHQDYISCAYMGIGGEERILSTNGDGGHELPSANCGTCFQTSNAPLKPMRSSKRSPMDGEPDGETWEVQCDKAVDPNNYTGDCSLNSGRLPTCPSGSSRFPDILENESGQEDEATDLEDPEDATGNRRNSPNQRDRSDDDDDSSSEKPEEGAGGANPSAVERECGDPCSCLPRRLRRRCERKLSKLRRATSEEERSRLGAQLQKISHQKDPSPSGD